MTDVLTMQRTFAADRARVWHAWTTVDGLAAWWWHHLPGTTYAVDLRVGGGYRIEAVTAGFGVAGEFLEIDPPSRLLLAWTWLDDGAPGDAEQVEITFTEVADGTRLDLRHTGPWTTAAPVENYRTGWSQTLDALDLLLTD